MGYSIKAENYEIKPPSTLAMLEVTADEAFKVYMTRKTQGWCRRWGCPRQSDAVASPGPGAAPGGAGSGTGAATPARPPAPTASDDKEASDSDLITGGGRRRSGAVANRGLGDVATRGQGIGHTPTKSDSKTSRLQPSPLIGQARIGMRVYSHRNPSCQ